MNETMWFEMNQCALSQSLERVRIALQRHVAPEQVTIEPLDVAPVSGADQPATLEVLCETFGLTPFERDVLLLCAGLELDARFAPLCVSAQNEQPTFELALAALPEPHWSALAPHAPLRYWRLVEAGSAPALTHSPLRIDERILHFLNGLRETDDRLTGWIEPLRDASDDLSPSHQSVVERIAAIWRQARLASAAPIIQICESDLDTQRAIAVAACRVLNLDVFMLVNRDLPRHATELAALVRLWDREAALSHGALVINANGWDTQDSGLDSPLAYLLDKARSPLLIIGADRRFTTQRTLTSVEIPALESDERRQLWHSALGAAAIHLNGQVERLLTQFQLTPVQVQAAVTDAQNRQNHSDDLGMALWSACRRQVRPQLDNLAQRLEPHATWDDLVLPELQKSVLREIAAHVRQRDRVYNVWGFQTRSANGLGITALFAGDSGTGKTMAAEVLANELHLDLYRIDLSQIVSKYIGETEKNLRRVFDAAEAGGAILLFDEADALFGKRSEVKDSHDRYANIEVSYLLQRMEAYRGLAILTTNLKNALDTAFMRRLRFVVQFPFPDARQRGEIWKRIFPHETPTDQLDAERMAKLNVTGGSIRNIALHAAFLAANANEPVRMVHVLQATRGEYAKLDKPLTDAEIKDWIMLNQE